VASWIEPDWPTPPGVRLISTLRTGGVSEGRYSSLNLGEHVGDDASRVAENRRLLRDSTRLPAEPRWLKQIHGVAVAELDEHTNDQAADASFTRHIGRVCAILTADCLPVMLAARSGEAVGAVHAGWRGLAAGVIESAVENLALPGEQLQAWLGPSIGPEHFEVGAEVRETFVFADATAESAFRPNARGRFQADLRVLARQRLERLGIRHIYGGEECTYAQPKRFFSYRRDGQTGRQATLIWRE
jgi:purine-nucleoside/S-methyl-5'-thioadenosine phosphorylase / adenosine deaminase